MAAIGLGGNLGDVAGTMRAAIIALGGLPGSRLLRASRMYRTPAWGMVEQPDFLNAVALLETSLPATDLLDALFGIERDFGRDRGLGERWGPRTLDLDLLLYGNAVIDAPGLTVPHCHLHERAFALLPLVEIAPQAEVPGWGRAVDLLAGLDARDCVAEED